MESVRRAACAPPAGGGGLVLSPGVDAALEVDDSAEAQTTIEGKTVRRDSLCQ
jgi:hypothetical protein